MKFINYLLCLSISVSSVLTSSQLELLKSEHPPSSIILSSSNQSSTTKNFKTGQTLGYITPWNPKGKELTLKYREKFDLVAPVWYTLHSKLTEGEEPVYEISGGPTNEDDKEWLKELQQVQDGQRKVKIVPRFFVDGWAEQDFLAFLSKAPSSVESLSSMIVEKVETNGYDGIVFESSAIWILIPLIHSLAEELHKRSTTFTLVLPPLRDPVSHPSIQKVNELILKSAREAVRSVDHFSIMTYDHSGGAGGMSLDIDSPLLNLDSESPLRKPEYSNIRLPGPNSPLDFISKNLELFSFRDLERSTEFGFNSNQMAFQDDQSTFESKLLMGIPLYGYTYPIAWISTVSGHSIPRKPPLSPIKSKDQDEEAQAKARATAEKREQSESYKNLIPVLRAVGDAIVHHQVLEIMEKRPLVRIDEASQEGIVDVSKDVLRGLGKQRLVFDLSLLTFKYVYVYLYDKVHRHSSTRERRFFKSR